MRLLMVHELSAYSHPADPELYKVGQIKRGQLIFLLVTSESIYKITSFWKV